MRQGHVGAMRSPVTATRPTREIAVRALKYDRRPHLAWRGGLVYDSPAGIVCLAPPGTVCTHHGKGIQFRIDHYGLSVFSRDTWFNAMLDFDPEGRPLQIYCNVALPYTADARSIEWVDLDLDVVMTPGATAALVDEDEFAANALAYRYPARVVERARTTASALLDRAGRGAFPFHWDGLDTVMAALATQFGR